MYYFIVVAVNSRNNLSRKIRVATLYMFEILSTKSLINKRLKCHIWMYVIFSIIQLYIESNLLDSSETHIASEAQTEAEHL